MFFRGSFLLPVMARFLTTWGAPKEAVVVLACDMVYIFLAGHISRLGLALGWSRDHRKAEREYQPPSILRISELMREAAWAYLKPSLPTATASCQAASAFSLHSDLSARVSALKEGGSPSKTKASLTPASRRLAVR